MDSPHLAKDVFKKGVVFFISRRLPQSLGLQLDHTFLLSSCKRGISVEHSLLSGLLDHGDRW